MPFEAWNYLITDKDSDKIFRHTNGIFLSKLTSAAQVMPNAFFGILYLSGALRINKEILEELWITDGYGIETFGLAMNQRCFRFLIRCILE